MPVVLLVVFGALPAFGKPEKSLGGVTVFATYVPILIALSIAGVALFSLTIPLPLYREQGILRRLSTTPAPPAWVLAAQVIINLCLIVTAMVLMVIIAFAGFGVATPKSPGGLVVAIALSIAGAFAYALWIAAVTPDSRISGGIAFFSYFPMIFFAGLWVPRAEMPGVLRGISNFTPLGASVQAVQSTIQNGSLPLSPLLVLPAYCIIFSAFALRFFRWE
jgi:ABC-2 type transport system permease protein